MQHHIIKSLLFSAYSLHLICFQRCSSPFQGSLSKVHRTFFTLALGAMLLTSFRPITKGEHELVGSWQYVKSAVAIHWDDPAPFHDSSAQDEKESERKDMTINADGSMTMMARDIESGRVYRDGDNCAMKFKNYDLTWVLSAATDSLKVMSPSGGSEMWRIDQLDGNTLVYVVDKPFESHIGSGILTYTYTYRRR